MLGLDVDCVNLRAESYTTDSRYARTRICPHITISNSLLSSTVWWRGYRIPQIRCGSAEEDAYRRDFTVNALFYNLSTGQVPPTQDPS